MISLRHVLIRIIIVLNICIVNPAKILLVHPLKFYLNPTHVTRLVTQTNQPHRVYKGAQSCGIVLPATSGTLHPPYACCCL